MLGKFLAAVLLTLPVLPVRAQDYVLYRFLTRKFDIVVTHLAYDPGTKKLYGSSPATATAAPDSILQIDPDSGVVLANIPVGSNPGVLAVDGANGLWVALDGESVLRRIDLTSLTPGPKLSFDATSAFRHITPSPADPNVLAVSRRLTNDTHSVSLISYGQVLPNQDSRNVHTLGFLNEFVLYGSGSDLNRYIAGPDGITFNDSARYDLGPFEVLDGRLYFLNGEVYQASTGTFLERLIPGPASSISINPLESAVYYLSSNATSRILHRVDLSTNRLDTISDLPEVDASARNLVTWDKGRAAFHSDTALYLVDQLIIVHEPPVLNLTQTSSPDPGIATSNLVFSLSLRNAGEGHATNIVVTVDFLTPDEILSAVAPKFTPAIAGQSVTIPINALKPLVRADIDITLRLSGLANVSARVKVYGESLAGGVSSFQRSYTLPILLARTNGLVTANLASKDMGYDSKTGKLLLANGSGGDVVWYVHPETGRIDSVKAGTNQAKIAVAPQGGAAYVGASNLPFPNIYPFITTNGLELLKPYTAAGTLIDLAISPVNTKLLAVADSSGVYLKLNRIHLPRETSTPGLIEFSEDGSRLFVRNTSSCSLNVYSNTPSGLILDETLTNAACRDFHIKDGLIFSDAGTVYDIAARQMIAEIPGLSAQSLVSPESANIAVTLSVEAGTWVLRRVRLEPLAVLGEVFVPNIQGSPANLIAWRAGSAAFRTSSQLFLAAIPALEISLSALPTAEGRLALTFNSTMGSTYRIEQSGQLPASEWIPAIDHLEATETTTSLVIDLPNSGHAFFRVTRISP